MNTVPHYASHFGNDDSQHMYDGTISMDQDNKRKLNTTTGDSFQRTSLDQKLNTKENEGDSMQESDYEEDDAYSSDFDNLHGVRSVVEFVKENDKIWF
jgi:hypothetical protein